MSKIATTEPASNTVRHESFAQPQLHFQVVNYIIASLKNLSQ